MKGSLKVNPGLHEDFKPYMGDAMYTSSDSHKTVEVTQPNSYKTKQPVKTSEIRELCEKLGCMYKKVYKKQMAGFSYYEYDESNKYVCFLSRGLLMQVNSAKFTMYISKYKDHNTLCVKVMQYEEKIVLVIREKEVFRKQAGFLQHCIDTLRTPFIMLQKAEKIVAAATSKTSRVIMMDLIILILNLRDGYYTATKLVTLIVSLYTFHYRYCELFNVEKPTYKPQTGANLTDMLFGFAMLGLPTEVMNAIKNFTALTGKRIFESELFMETAGKMFEALTVIIKWIANPYGSYRIISEASEKVILKVLDRLGSAVFMHKDIKHICDIYTRYVTNPQILFDPTFREEIMLKYKSLKASVAFMDYLQNGGNRYFQTTWNLFEANVVKSCEAFDSSGREEPICIIFEGEAGSGKSQLMNMFVELLRESGKTIYCHAIPAAEDGRDFYDDYEGQFGMVLDDLAQQGKSQLRFLINFVSPVKYPLPCANAAKKNTKFFTSKLILATMNHFTDLSGFTASDCISEPEALYRRAHVIKVNRGQSDHFSQVLRYYKYDHINSKNWENKFINHTAVNVPAGLQTTFSTEAENSPMNIFNTLSWVYKVYRHIQASEDRNRKQMIISSDECRRILREVHDEEDNHDEFFEAQSFGFVNYLSGVFDRAMHFSPVVDYKSICSEYVKYMFDIVTPLISDAAATIAQYAFDLSSAVNGNINEVLSTLKTGEVIFKMLAFAIGTYVVSYFFGREEVVLPSPAFKEENLDHDFYQQSQNDKHEYFGAAGSMLETEHDQWAVDIKRYCKTLIVKHDSTGLQDEHTQCVVSGKRILLPAHLDVGDKFVDIYNSWDHYLEKHVEIENVQLKLVKRYLLSDLAIYEIKNTIPLYKLNRQIFSPNGCTSAKNWFLINSTGILKVCYDVDINRNKDEVTYSTVHGNMNHAKNTGFYTPYSSSGACGTVLAAPGVGIIGFHVAGSPNMGFCVEPRPDVMMEIRELMMQAPHAEGFDICSKVTPGISGVRLRYEKPIQQTRVNGSTNFVPSPLHVNTCEEMAKLISDVETREEYTPVPLEKIDVKTPPNFSSKGTPAKTLKALSQKTFMRQGRVTEKELSFIKDYLRTVMIEFDDLDDDEVAFGGKYVPALNKDSSNGYNCKKGKDKYFDFENKIIKDEAHALFAKIARDAEEGVFDYNEFLCKETFKDELRKSTKVDQPRTFRIMPLGHIWWTKKIFGKLLNHFKDTRMKTGISVGYNPYLDADELAKKLLTCFTTGDADFGKWDGTILAIFIYTIIDVMKEFYRGKYGKIIDWLACTIANSFVLVNDEIWATTHGLPSGTWLTLLLNCLINKCLTALVIYRYKPDPHVDDVHDVVDFVTGDDKVFGADEEMSKYFNLLNIKEVTESLGMDCTNGDKTKIEKPSQPFEKLTYVKRHFRKHPVLKRYVGCLSLDTIMNTLQWIDSSTEDTHEAMMGKMRSMQVEAYLHSKALFAALTTIFESKYPFDAFFNENRVLKILTDSDGYDQIITMQNKNFLH